MEAQPQQPQQPQQQDITMSSSRRKEKKAARMAKRPHPYAKEQKMADAAGAASASASNAPTGETRGQMLQRYDVHRRSLSGLFWCLNRISRHKREYKEVKRQADELREQKYGSLQLRISFPSGSLYATF